MTHFLCTYKMNCHIFTGPAAGEIQVTNLTDHDVMPDVSVKVEKDKDAEFNQVVIGEMKKQLAKVFKTEIEQIGDALIEGSATAENDRKTSKIN